MAVSGLGVTYAVTGFLLVYSGVKNVTLKDELTSFLKGQVPAANPTGPVQIGISGTGGGSSSSGSGGSGSSSVPPGSVSSSAIASDATQYAGHAYLYGGAPGATGKNPWDCSSYCNWVLSHDLNLPWPGSGRYSGSTHGPATGSWGLFFTAKGWTVKGGIANAQAGDVIVWTQHMGIALGGGKMISALNEHLGTLITPISGNSSGSLMCVGRYPGDANPYGINGRP